MNFIPDQPKTIVEVPYFDEVSEQDGWRGHATNKSIDTLKSEIMLAITRLGGNVTAFQRGVFQIGEHSRDGFQVRYYLKGPEGQTIPGRIDVAALPVKETARSRQSLSKRREQRREQALKMALFNVRDAIDGLRRLQQLSPGYAALMPFMLAPGSDKTITQLWSDNAMLENLLPPGGEGDFVVEGTYRKI
ncbi:MAG: hypothetical protein JW908_00470 [Anaerolineales bacterium]|nr:hypothetical protein [Anaerolineales bacterium]